MVAPHVTAARQPKQDRSRQSLLRILTAAEKAIASRGLAGFSLAEVLKAAGVSNGAFYARFRGVSELICAVQSAALDQVEADVEAAFAGLARPGLTIQEVLQGFAVALVAAVRSRGELLGALIAGTRESQVLGERAAVTHGVMEDILWRLLAMHGVTNRAAVAAAHDAMTALLLGRLAQPGMLAAEQGWQALSEELAAVLVGRLSGELPAVAAITIRQAGRARKVPSAFSQRKIKNILDAAQGLFLSQGFGQTSMAEVAAAARVGKATVYAHFASKDELFKAVIVEQSSRQLSRLTAGAGVGLAETLRRFGEEAADLLLSQANTATLRLIISESARFPELGRIFYEAGPARLHHALAAFLTEAMARGEVREVDPEIAAAHFFALVSSDRHLKVITLDNQPYGASREEVQAGVDVFLAAYKAEPPKN